MKRVFRYFIFLMAFCDVITAYASGDIGCTPEWNLNPRGLEDNDAAVCNNLPLLFPSNDSRVNLQLLLVDSGDATLPTHPAQVNDGDYGYGNVPFTRAGFDTMLLQADTPPTAPPVDESANNLAQVVDAESDYAEGEGSRCTSNVSGSKAFIAAVQTDTTVTAGDRASLIALRQSIQPNCASNQTFLPQKPSLHSGADFFTYLEGIGEFYAGHYHIAQTLFSKLEQSRNAWLKETSFYMLARNAVNWEHGYGYVDLNGSSPITDTRRFKASQEMLENYLHLYPDGQYASSARGLLRRVYAQSKQWPALAEEFDWQVTHPGSAQNDIHLPQFAYEVDHVLLNSPAADLVRSPVLLATVDLMNMRPVESWQTGRKILDLKTLQAQQPYFASKPELYHDLVAIYTYYVQHDAAATLQLVPATLPQNLQRYTDFTSVAIRGMALEALHHTAEARGLWLSALAPSKAPLQHSFIELAVAINEEYAHQLTLVFANNSPIRDPKIRQILIQNDASPELLRHIIQTDVNKTSESHAAIYTLLLKELLYGHARQFVHDYSLLPPRPRKPVIPDESPDAFPLALFRGSGPVTNDHYTCPSTLKMAKLLARRPSSAKGLLCLAEFMRRNNLSPASLHYASYDVTNNFDDENPHHNKNPSPGLGQAPTEFPGKSYTSGGIYIETFNNHGNPVNMRAYALHRAIQCYAPASNNTCDGQAVDAATRRKWFLQLKHDYPHTIWAQAQKYYW